MPLTIPADPVRVRIAPSPTGDPHVGTAYVALFNKALAEVTGGRFILRIEDTDRKRYQAGSEEMIYEALRWLGLDHDEGPDKGGPLGPYRQSERNDLYRKRTEELLRSGKAYRCFCTAERLAEMREEQRAKNQSTGYDGLCRDLSDEEQQRQIDAGTPFVVRLAVPRTGETIFEDALRGSVTIHNEQTDDQVLVKSDGFPTYHLANVVDDHEMGITHVLRGEEWISSTPKHVLLYAAFGWDAPQFCHLPLLRKADKNKSKLSKRKDPVSCLWYREQGFLKEALLNFLGLMGYSMPDEREVFSREEFFREFDPTRLKTTGPAFDLQKLEWLNGEWIRRLDLDTFIERIHGHFGDRYRGHDELTRKVAPLIQERIRKLSEWPAHADLFYAALPDYDRALLMPKKLREEEKAREVLEKSVEALTGIERFAPADLEARCRELAGALGHKVGPVFMVLRVAVTGSAVSPPLFETMEILGRSETLDRLGKALQRLG